MNCTNYALNYPVCHSVEGAPGMTTLIHTSYVCPQGCPELNVMFFLLRDLEQGIKKKKVRNTDTMLLEQRNFFFFMILSMTRLGGLRLRGWQRCLKCKICMFWQNKNKCSNNHADNRPILSFTELIFPMERNILHLFL